jgi:hypothetical protein
MIMNFHRPIHFRTFAAFLALVLVSVQFGTAQSPSAKPIVVSQLKGTWYATFSGVTGCGTTTLVSTFTLDATGNGTQTSATEHTAGCGDIDLSGQSAQIQSLNSSGSGFLALGCGSGCGFGFTLQVPKNAPVAFNLGAQPVSGNYLSGVAFRIQ